MNPSESCCATCSKLFGKGRGFSINDKVFCSQECVVPYRQNLIAEVRKLSQEKRNKNEYCSYGFDCDSGDGAY